MVFFLGFFLVLTQFLYSQSLLTALAMLVSVWGLLTALVLAHMPVGRPRWAWPLAWPPGRRHGAPIMVVLFLLFPRIGPLWGGPKTALGQMGLSGHLSARQVAELAQDDSIAMRLRFGKARRRRRALYFRGPVLHPFDGSGEWRPLLPQWLALARQMRPSACNTARRCATR